MENCEQEGDENPDSADRYRCHRCLCLSLRQMKVALCQCLSPILSDLRCDSFRDLIGFEQLV